MQTNNVRLGLQIVTLVFSKGTGDAFKNPIDSNHETSQQSLVNVLKAKEIIMPIVQNR